MRIERRRWIRSVISMMAIAGVMGLPAPPAGAESRPGTPGFYSVQLPSDYYETSTSYPVLYLLPGEEGDENRWFEVDPELPALADQGVIIVSVFNRGGFYNDWRKGPHAYETLYTDTLIEEVDSTYRTIPDRAYRAVAGVSEGGYGAMLFASRHPDLYSVAGSFSGPVDITDPSYLSLASAIWIVKGSLGGAVMTEDPLAAMMPIFGDAVRDEVWWHARNPTDLASNLDGVNVWHATGDGIPSAEDITTYGPDAPFGTMGLAFSPVIETIARRLNDNFDRALTAASIPHTYRTRGGAHLANYNVADLHEWFPLMLDAFGATPPQTFDYRSVDADFSVWGWRFNTDPERAPEWLEVEDASSSGFTLTGSGLTTVTTAPLFDAGTSVLLDGATVDATTADSEGRISFQVDLGKAHTLQQYTAAQRAAGAVAQGDYFTTKSVAFSPCPGRSPAHACQRHASTSHGNITP